MTLYKFNVLDEMEQIETVWNTGVKLAERRDGDQLYELYQIEAFYIELRGHIDSPGYNNIRTFKTTTLLEPYLGQVKLPENFF